MPSDFAASVEKVFEGRVFRVPDYQRGYAWDASNWQDLLDDLDLLEPGRDHYTGTIVLHLRGDGGLDNRGKAYVEVDIVDGQQRLTTLVILMDAIRSELAHVPGNHELAAGIRAGYVVAERRTGEPLYRLQLGQDSNHFWTQAVIGGEGAMPAEITAHQRLLDAKAYFSRYLGQEKVKRGDAYPDFLDDLFDRVAHRLQLIPYEVDDAAEVGVIFEVMNDRGKPLTELEKKNYLLYVATKLSEADGLSRLVNDSWASLLRRLMEARLGGSSDEDQLLRAHWFMAYVPSPREFEGTASIKARFGLKAHRDRHDVLLREVRAYVLGLETSSAAFCDIMVPSRPGAFALGGQDARTRRRMVEATERLLRLRVVAPFLPILIAARMRHPEDAGGYIDLVDACERYAFRVSGVLQARADKGTVQLNRHAHDLYHQNISISQAVDLVHAMTRTYCPDVIFHALLEAESNWYAWKALRYFLYEYEYEAAGRRAVQVSWERLAKRDLERTVEHVLPQTATHADWRKAFDEPARRRWTHDIGNLCLTEDNSAYGNRPFAQKRGQPNLSDAAGRLIRCYANAMLFQERELAALDDWTPSVVEARRDRILAWARRRWAVPQGPPAAAEEPEPD